ncbi:MAG: hypothetical protein JSR45_03860 [Proteobacteria bacterium]|nr:hypothetical protein [Pseudomonadota bacterium]
MSQTPLWICPDCGRDFANRNQTHTCAGPDSELEHHFRGKPPEIRRLFDTFVERVRTLGPVTVLSQKTRIAFHVRMSFAQLTPKQGWIDGHLVLAERHDGPMFRKVTTFSPRNHLHEFRLNGEGDLTPAFIERLAEAYAVGRQEHLKRPAPKPGR